jgi:hypothetical protein
MQIATQETTLNLVVLSVKDLGFPKGATLQQIYDRAILEFGLCLCPAEVGPQLRLQYPNQPDEEWLIVAMEAITDLVGDLFVFSVIRSDSGLWLSADWDYPDNVWDGANHFVFRVSCK